MKRVLTCVLLALPVFAHADVLKLHAAKLATPPSQINVEFETPVALTDCDVEYPSRQAACQAPVVPWVVVVYDASGNPSQVLVTSAVDRIGNLSAHGSLTLTLASAIPEGWIRVDVTFNKQNKPHISIEPKAETANAVTAPPTKENSDVYLSGTFAPAVGATPDYTTDSKVSLPFKYFGENQSSTISAAATVQTDSKGTADPDGFYWGIPVQHVFTQPFSAQWSVVGMELDKRGNAVNFVSAPSVTGSLRHVFYVADKKHAGDLRVAAMVGLDLTAGVEFGSNLRDEFKIVNKPGQGEGGFFRGVPSTTAYLSVPQILHLSKITLSSSYTARIPTSDELFLETRNTKTPIPLLTSQTRNWVQNSLQFNITDNVAIQIKHQYGSIPPAFSFVQNSGSVGVVYTYTKKKPK